MQMNADLSHDAPLPILKDAVSFSWEDVCVELLAKNPWDFDNGSPDKAWAKIVDPDVGKHFTNSAKIALKKGIFLRNELIDFFIAEFLRLHSKTLKQMSRDQYLTQG
jgi:hypothetical protein